MMRLKTAVHVKVAAFFAALVMSPSAISAGVEEEIAELRNELTRIKKDLAEMKSILQSSLKPRNARKITATVGVSGRPSLGREDALVTLVEFSDYQCPFCRRRFSSVYSIMQKDYIETGKLRYVFRDFFHRESSSAGEESS